MTLESSAVFNFYEPSSHEKSTESEKQKCANEFDAAAPEVADDEALQVEINQWIAGLLVAEVERITLAGSPKPIQLAVKRSSMEVDWSRPTMPQATNRLEVQTRFPFERVRQILVSEPIDCPMNKELKYVHLVLFTDKPLPLIMPYVYHAKYRASPPRDIEAPASSLLNSRKILVRNKLNRWMFVNSIGQVSRHQIDQFDEI